MLIPMRKNVDAPEAKVGGRNSAAGECPPSQEARRCPGPPLSPRDVAGLRGYQLETVSWLRARRRGLLADQMGVGKTAPVLRAITTPRGIIVCPASLATNWARECAGPLSTENGAPAAGWRPDLTPRILQKRGDDIVPKEGELVIAPFERMPTEVSEDRLVHADLSDVTVAIDEVHYTKNSDAQRTRKCRALVRQAGWAWGLTGTPIPNRPLDLYGALETLELIGETFESWPAYVKLMQGMLDNYGNWKFGFWRNGQRIIQDWRLERAAELVRPVMLRRLKSEVLKDLPPKVYSERLVALSAKDETIEIKTAAAKWKLYGAEKLPPFEMLSQAMKQIALVKIPAMFAEVERHEEAELPLVVFSAHVEPIVALSQRPGWAGFHGGTSPTQRDRMVRDFQAGHLKGLGLTIQSGGVGLTLTRSCNAVFVDRAHNPYDNIQAEDRLHRLGQRDSVNITHLVADHVLDRWQMALLADKRRTTEAVIG